MKPASDPVLARRVILKHARLHRCSFDAVASGRRFPSASAARHGAWAELHNEHGWGFARIARACGCHHTSVSAALNKRPPGGCPACGEKYLSTTDAEMEFVCGVATQRAYRHPGGLCVVQIAWRLKESVAAPGESEAA